jgi:acyl-coenzyme A thioesterase PaaI-like protein
VEARATILRRGRTTLVVEALVVNVADDGADVGGPVGWASMTFTILPRRSDRPVLAVPEDPPVRWAFEGAGLAVPVLEALSVRVDPSTHRVSMPALPYAANSFGAVQGGVMALLAEVAGGEAVGGARGPGAGPVAVTDLQVAYLALGRVGPIESDATVLGAGPGRLPHSAVVELRDGGAEDGGRVTTVATVVTAPVGAPVVPAGAGRLR